MSLKVLWRLVFKVVVSLAGGILFHLLWLVLFLLVFGSGGQAPQPVLWLLAPAVTAAGFTVGAAALEPAARTRRGFPRLLIWPLVGCAVGAGAVYRFGPMLIVFGMLAAGTLSVLLREILSLSRSQARDDKGEAE